MVFSHSLSVSFILHQPGSLFALNTLYVFLVTLNQYFSVSGSYWSSNLSKFVPFFLLINLALCKLKDKTIFIQLYSLCLQT